MAEIKVTSTNFAQTVEASELPILVDFWASWCGPCMMLAPVVEQLSELLAGKVNVGKVNVDEQPELAQQFMVYSIPTLILFKNGKPAAQTVGYQGKEQLLAWINSNL